MLSRRSLVAASSLACLRPAFALSATLSAGVAIERRYVDGPYGQIHMRIARPSDSARETQPPLACFHFSPGSGRMYEPLLPYLATDRLVMAFDTPGYGNSDPPPEQPWISDYAAALADAIRQITDAPKIDVMGQLTGSLTSIELAVTRPDLVRRVVLSRAPVFTEETRVNGVAEMKRRHAERIADPAARHIGERLARGLGRLGEGDPPERYLGAFIDSLLPGHNWVYGEVAAFSYRADLNMPRIIQPTLFITWIEDDAEDGGDFGGLSEWTRGRDIIPNVTPLNITGLGRWPWQEHPEVIAGHVRGFLNAD